MWFSYCGVTLGGNCATTSVNLIVIPALCFSFFFFLCFVCFGSRSSPETMPSDTWCRCCATVVSTLLRFHLRASLTWYLVRVCFHFFSKALCPRFSACNVNFPACTLKDAFLCFVWIFFQLVLHQFYTLQWVYRSVRAWLHVWESSEKL